MARLYFEDLDVDETVDLGTRTVTESDIRSFAERYDPQPIHLDDAAARESPYGGVIASGWHTAAVCMRQVVDGFLVDAATRGAIGVDRLRWPAPVRPGDELAVELRVVETGPWPRDADRDGTDAGLAHCEVTATRRGSGDGRSDEDGGGDADETVLSMVGLVLFARRP